MQGAFVRAQRFGVTRAERQMHRAADFFVEQNLFDAAPNSVIRADAEFAPSVSRPRPSRGI